jgi:hypothetical protein
MRKELFTPMAQTLYRRAKEQSATGSVAEIHEILKNQFDAETAELVISIINN